MVWGRELTKKIKLLPGNYPLIILNSVIEMHNEFCNLFVHKVCAFLIKANQHCFRVGALISIILELFGAELFWIRWIHYIDACITNTTFKKAANLHKNSNFFVIANLLNACLFYGTFNFKNFMADIISKKNPKMFIFYFFRTIWRVSYCTATSSKLVPGRSCLFLPERKTTWLTIQRSSSSSLRRYFIPNAGQKSSSRRPRNLRPFPIKNGNWN